LQKINRYGLIVLLALLPITAAAQGRAPSPVRITPALLRADSMSMAATRLLLKGRHDSAAQLLQTALQLAQQEHNVVMTAKCYVSLGSLQLMRTRYNEARRYVQLATPLLPQINDYPDIVLSAHLLLANIFNFQGKKDSALAQYQVAADYADRYRPYRKYELYAAMAELYNRSGNVDKAQHYFQQAHALTATQTHRPEHAYVLLLVINFYLAHDMAAQAAPFVAEYDTLMARRERQKFDDPMRELLRGLVDSRLKNSMAFMQEMKAQSLLKNQPLHAIVANTYLIRYYEGKGQLDTALHLAQENEALVKATGQIEDVYSALRIRHGLLRQLGRYEAASRVGEELFALKDSILKMQNHRLVAEMETRYQTQQREKEIEVLTYQKQLGDKSLALLGSEKQLAQLLLSQEIQQRQGLLRENGLMDSVVKSEQAYSLAVRQEKEKQQALNAALDRENRLKAGQLQKERRTVWLLAAGAGLLLLSGFAIFSLYRSQKKKNALIQRQAADLEVLMKEIHHRVKNNLQVVSSLLDLQSRSIADQQASAAVKEGKNRVQSMALIHQNLYSEGNIKGIRVREYIHNLVETLCASYNISNDQVNLNTQIDDLNLDVDTMIPLGLVLNELVSNSFKYAFANGRPGRLDILLCQQPGFLQLRVSDDGPGFPAGLDVGTTSSFGLKMVRAFAQKLKAKLALYNRDGAVADMQITKYKTA
jgi:two-component sensor histidine kinase